MAFWNRNKNWEDEYDDYYAQDRGTGERRELGSVRYLAHLLSIALIGGLFVAAVGYVSGVTMVEKLLTQLASPLGLIWLTLLLMVYFCLLGRQRWPAMVGMLCWLVLTIAGNQLVVNLLAGSLEGPYRDVDPCAGEPFDLVVLLGGGTGTAVNGRSQSRIHGDRVVVAAAMYHAGTARRIVCTGSQTFRSTDQDLHPREEAVAILRGLDVPQDVLLQMRGANTSEEMANLKQWLQEHPVDGRVGLLTSAWHLPRALRLARANGLELEPIPADFLAEPFQPGPDIVIPSAANLHLNSALCKEYLARLVGR